MKGGQTPVLIQRWAPSDFQDDEEVRLLLMEQDWQALVFYRQFLDHAWMSGGDLPADPRRLAAKLSLPTAVVEHGLRRLLGVLVHADGERLYQRRVRRDIQAELAYRAEQSRLGAAGARKRWARRDREPHGEPHGVAVGKSRGSHSPPAPAPAPSPPGSSEVDEESSLTAPPSSPPPPRKRADARPRVPDSLLSAIPDFPALWTDRLRGMPRRPTPSAEGKQLAALAAALPEFGAEAIRRHVAMLAESGWATVAIDKLGRANGSGPRLSAEEEHLRALWREDRARQRTGPPPTTEEIAEVLRFTEGAGGDP